MHSPDVDVIVASVNPVTTVPMDEHNLLFASSHKKSSENGGTHGARSLFVKSPVVSENVSTCVSQTPLTNLVCLRMQK